MTEKKTLVIDGTPFVIEYDNVDFSTEMETFLSNLNTDVNNFNFKDQIDKWDYNLIKDSFKYEGDEDEDEDDGKDK